MYQFKIHICGIKHNYSGNYDQLCTLDTQIITSEMQQKWAFFIYQIVDQIIDKKIIIHCGPMVSI